MAADDTFEIDLCSCVVFVADDDSRTADIFEARIFDPELFRVTRIDGDCGWNVFEVAAHECKSCLVLFDGGYTLAFEGGVEKRKLPSWRGFPRHDSVLAAIEMQVLRFIADVVQTGHAGANAEVHVSEVAMLGRMKADADSRGISTLDLDVDVAHCGVEGPWIRI